MLLSIFSILIGFLISFTPPTAIVGVVIVFILSFAYSKSTKKYFKMKDVTYSIIGLALGTAAGLTIYGKSSYIHQWHSLWWIPTLWLVGSLGGLIIFTRRSKGDLENEK